MKFVFTINDRMHLLSGAESQVRRQFGELTANVQPDAIAPRSLALTTRESLDLSEARLRRPHDLFNVLSDAVPPVIDNAPVTNGLELPKLFAEEAPSSSAPLFQSFPSGTGSLSQGVDLEPLGMPQLFGEAPQADYSGSAGYAPTGERPREIDLSALGLPRSF